MNKLLIIGAAAAAFTAAPAFADDYMNYNGNNTPCVSSLTATQTECAVNLVYRGKWNDQWIKQSQTGELKKMPKGEIQLQVGLNAVLYGKGNDQGIKQHQNIESKGKVYGESPYTNHDSQTQIQAGLNVVYQGDHNDQSIHQGQTYDNNTWNDVHGTEQAQGALNVVVQGSGNEQSITQHQSLEIGSSHNYGGGNPS